MKFIEALTAALQCRPKQTVRLINGIGSSADLDGLIVDRFESCALVHTYSSAWGGRKNEIADCLRAIGIESVVVWDRDIDPKETTKRGGEILFGDPPQALPVVVDGIQLLLKPFKTASGGIFLDTRDIRRELIAQCKGNRVLNLFCFTGSLGIAASVGGAREVTHVDISQSVIDWAKENAALQERQDAVIKYFTDDALDVLQRCARRREKGTDPVGFDTIIIDPPAFGTTGNKRFDLSESINKLLQLALMALAEHGTIYLMCNETKILPETLARMVPKGYGVRHVRAPLDTHPGELSKMSVMRGIIVTK